MKCDLEERIKDDIVLLAKACEVDRVVFFGSRARGDNWERSDVDLAVEGGKSEKFREWADSLIDTLLFIDVVNLDRHVSDELRQEIAKDGVAIYERSTGGV